ncbi:MAG: Hsp20/alpha crystallin family protein [Planctomycetes bacterium]|nr:Hsp20/alpha crystallin family protein [Planctomycetota bacterium]
MLTTLPNRVSALFADPFQAVFRDFDSGYAWNGNTAGLRKVAPLSMWADGAAVYIEMDVPGIALDDLDVSVQEGKLTIRGERKSAERPADFMHEERFFGQFERTVMLNEWVDPATIEATLKDGVLHLKLSKRPEAQRQKIAINSANGSDAKRIETSN